MWLAYSSPVRPIVAKAFGGSAPSGRPAAAAASRPRHPRRQQRTGSRTASTTAANSLDDVASSAGAAGSSSERGGTAEGVQPPSGSSSSSSDELEPQQLEDENIDYVQHCQEMYGRPGLIDFSAGVNGLPKATLQHPSGASCELYLHGGTVTSWRHSDGREMLHLRERNTFDGVNPISGGIQIAWPQYGVGPLPTHGFFQNLHWSVVDTAWREPEAEQPPDAFDMHVIDDWRPTISLYADSDEDWAAVWPHKFQALYSITLMQPDPRQPSDVEVMREAAEHFQPWIKRQRQQQQQQGSGSSQQPAAPDARRGAAATAAAARQRQQQVAPVEEKVPLTPSVLRCLLQVHNCDDAPFTFTTGLRTHFVTRDIPTFPKFPKVLGLAGKYVLDFARDPTRPSLDVQDGHYVTFGDMEPQNRLFVDCEAEGDVLFCPGTPAHFHISNAQGFSDIAVVHPTGLAPRECRRFVGLDSARAVRKVTLRPGATWVGEMVLTAHDRYWDLPAWEQEDTSGVPIPVETPHPDQARRAMTLYEQLSPDQV